MRANEAREIIKKVWSKIDGDDDPFIGRVEVFDNSIRAVVEDVVAEVIDDGECYIVLADGGYMCTVTK